MNTSPVARNLLKVVSPLLIILTILTNCSDHCTVRNEYVYFEPVYTTFQELRSSVASNDPRELSAPGKIYFKDDFLYINERAKGIHVIDNTDPSNPKPVSFINIPGNADLAILNNVLYADSYTDLVAIDIGVAGEEKEIGRYENLFSSYSSLGFQSDPVRGVVTGWAEVNTITVEENECEMVLQAWGGRWFGGGVLIDAASAQDVMAYSVAPGGNSTGVGGSMARFTISADYLYALDGGFLDVVKIGDPQAMQLKTKMQIGWDIETIFPNKDKLFLGSRSGMHIFSIQSPESPEKLSVYQHIRSCDPVVVEGDYAYVTLRGGSTCGGFSNQLEVIDIKNILAPVLVKIYPMTGPYGLGIESGTLFVCDGKDGLKIFDTTDKLRITENQLAHYKEVQAFDIIPFQKVAMVIGEDGLYQYDYSDVKNIQFLSHLPIVPKP